MVETTDARQSFAERFSQSVTARSGLVVLLWVVVLLIVRGTSPSWQSLALDGDFDHLPATRPSVAAEQLLDEAFPVDRSRSQMAIVIARQEAALDRGDELVALDLLRRLHHHLAEVLIAKSASVQGTSDLLDVADPPLPGGPVDDAGQPAEPDGLPASTDRSARLLALALESLDEAIEADEQYYQRFQKTAGHQRLPVEQIRLTLAYWDRSELLQRLNRSDDAGPDLQAALTLDPGITDAAVPISQRDLQPWSSLLDVISWNDDLLGARLSRSRARLIVLRSESELAATHNIEFLEAVNRLINRAVSLHRDVHRSDLEVLATGSAAIGGATLIAARDAIRYTEWFTVLIILVILTLVYRSPLLIAVPLVSIFLAVAVSTGALAWLAYAAQQGWTGGWDFRIFTTSRIFLFVILFGAGTDYCLFLIARLREEAIAEPWEVAVPKALSGVGRALLGSALTTVVGLAMLALADFGKYQHTGPMIAIALLIGLCVCVTFTPALLTLIGPLVFWPSGSMVNRQRHLGLADAGTAPTGASAERPSAGLWGMIALLLMRRPGLVLVAGIGLMILPAWHGWSHERDVTYDLSSGLSHASASRHGLRLLDEHFGMGEITPTTVVLVRNQAAEERQLANDAKQLARRLYAVQGVRAVRHADDPLGDFPPDRAMSLLSKDAWKRRALRSHRITRNYFFSSAPQYQGRLVRLDIVMRGNPFELQTAHRVTALGQWLQAETNDRESAFGGAQVYMAGTTPSIIDLSAVTLADHRRIKLAVAAAVFVVLVVIVRRVLLSGYLVFTVLLSYYATLGLTLVVFRIAYGDDFIGLDWKLPLFLFVILVAVGQDYNVYLVTRILEEQRRGGRYAALRRAVARTGGIITACGLVMAGTFLSMTASAWAPWIGGLFGIGQSTSVRGIRGIVELGFALGLGVLIDTFYVRTLLVPAFVALLERWRRLVTRQASGAWIGSRSKKISTTSTNPPVTAKP